MARWRNPFRRHARSVEEARAQRAQDRQAAPIPQGVAEAQDGRLHGMIAQQQRQRMEFEHLFGRDPFYHIDYRPGAIQYRPAHRFRDPGDERERILYRELDGSHWVYEIYPNEEVRLSNRRSGFRLHFERFEIDNILSELANRDPYFRRHRSSRFDPIVWDEALGLNDHMMDAMAYAANQQRERHFASAFMEEPGQCYTVECLSCCRIEFRNGGDPKLFECAACKSKAIVQTVDSFGECKYAPKKQKGELKYA